MLVLKAMVITVLDLLSQIYSRISHITETPTLDAQVLVAHFLDKSRPWVMAHPEALLDDDQYNKVIQGLERLELGEPLPYVIGHWEFHGLDFHLSPDVLIPRPETEMLVERGINWLHNHPDHRTAIDVGTGSGCIGISLAMSVPDLSVLMTDISQIALNVAQVNANKFDLSGRLTFRSTDLLEGIVEHFDLICANLPYIPTQALMKLPIADREPRLALDGGNSGTELISMLLDQARSCLAPGGLILLEIESSQGAEVKNIACTCFPAASVEILKDLSGWDRCIQIFSSNLLVHLCQRKEWLRALEQGIFTNKSLNQQGFIHCSQPQQILQVANNFYKGIPELVLLWIDPEKITSKLIWEAADGVLFPHIYGPISLDAVIAVSNFQSDVDGIYRTIEFTG